MKNKTFYNVVNKTKLIDVFKKNKVMTATYFGQLSANSLDLDFTKQDTYNKLVNASPWVASEPHTDYTIYRRNANFSQELTSEGTKLFTTGNASTDRYGMVTTAGPGLGNKISYKVEFNFNWTGTPVESAEKALITWFIGNNPSDADHTRFNINAANGSTTIAFQAISVEGNTSRVPLTEISFTPNVNHTIQLIWDLDNHTIQIFLDNNTLGSYPFYGETVGYVNLAGTSQAAYKPETSLTVKSIEIKGV